MNKLMITGNLTKDAELQYTKNTNMAITKFTIANNVGYDDKKKTSFVNCILFGKRAESMINLLRKGTSVLIDGRLELTSNKKDDGTYQNFTNVLIDDIEITRFINDEKEGK